LEREQVRQLHRVHLGRGEAQQRLLLARDEQAVGGLQVVQRFDPEVIARPESPPLLSVPDHEREHAAKPVEHGLAPVVVAGHDHLRVAVGGKLGTMHPGQLFAQFEIVIISRR
jgi:hypothetical protein